MEAMGGGDIKLLFMSGLFLGLAENVICLILACLIGIAFGLVAAGPSKNPEDAPPEGQPEEMAPGAFPWGPSIAIAAWISMLCGNELANWYLSLL